MGGCCCCYSRRAESDRTLPYFYCPQDTEESEPLSSTSNVTLSVMSPGLLVDNINLITFTPATYGTPPEPLPFDVAFTSSQTVPRHVEICRIKADRVLLANSQTSEETNGRFETLRDKNRCEHNCSKITEDVVSISIGSTADEDDICAICLEDYDAENPRIMTKCKHHFHLSCILEWMERSDNCAICDRMMVIDNTYIFSPERISSPRY